MAVDSNGIAYLFSDYLYKTTDYGNNWSKKELGVSRKGYVRALYIDHEHHVYIGADNIYRSKDFGETWEELILDASVVSIAVNKEGHIFAATGDGLMKSEDDGQTWTTSLESTTFPSSIAIDMDSSYYYTAIKNIIYRSLDKGQTWDTVNMSNSNPGEIIIAENGNPVAANFYGCRVSTDRGETWEYTQLSNESKASSVFNSLTVDYDGNIYRLFGNKNREIFISKNHGLNWELYTTVPDFGIRGIYFSGLNDFFGTSILGVFRMDGNQFNWQLSSNGIQELDILDLLSNGNMESFISNNSGWLYSRNDGENWEILLNGGIIDEIAFLNEKKIYAVIDSKLYMFNEIRDSLIFINNTPAILTTEMVIQNDSTFILNGYSSSYPKFRIYRTSDSGKTWNNIWESNSYIENLSVNSEWDIFASVNVRDEPDFLLRSKDEGEKWDSIEINSGSDFVISGKDDLILWSSGNLLQSIDKGDSWDTIYDFGANQRINSFTESSSGMMFVGTISGVQYSEDDGISWTFADLYEVVQRYFDIENMAMTSNNDLLVSSFQGTYKLILNPTSVDPENHLLIHSGLNQIQVFPNPVKDLATIQLYVPQPSNVTINIYNLNGQLIRALANNQKFADGLHDVLWNLTDESGLLVPSGVYVSHVIIGDKTKSFKIIVQDR